MATFPKLKNPFILAPMAGVTDDVFRRLCVERGAALVYSEMVSAKALRYGDRKSFDMLAHSGGSEPIAYQLFGSDPAIMAEAVARLDEAEREAAASSVRPGYSPGDLRRPSRESNARDTYISCVSYDVNMGCPVAKVVKNGEGSALMRDIDRAARLVEATTRVTEKPVTVKTRSGWDADDAAADRAVEFARAMEQAGAAAVALHGRTREQYYGGKADWEVIARVKDAVTVPVIGSGDVMSAADATRMLRETGCDFVMIARGALGNPWIFEDAVSLRNGAEKRTARGAEERARTFIRHALMLEADKGEYVAVREMRKHVAWYFKGLPGVHSLRAKVNTEKSLLSLTSLVSDAFLPRERLR